MSFWNRPHKLIVELTNLCNLRCKMCGIWAEPGKKMMGTAAFERLLQDRCMGSIRHIALTGGEPFLLNDLEKYHELAKKNFPRAYINISTNGFLTKRIIEFLDKVDTRKLSMTISYDGVRSHDSIRGVEASKERLLETAVKIREKFPEIELSLKMTVTNENHGEILETARQCNALGIPFRFKTLEKLNNCQQSRYPAEITDDNYGNNVKDSIIWQAKEVLRLGMGANRKYIKMLIEKHGGARIGCTCSDKVVFIGIDGKVFLCRKHESIGNVFHKDFSEIWKSSKRTEVAREMGKIHSEEGLSISYINN